MSLQIIKCSINCNPPMAMSVSMQQQLSHVLHPRNGPDSAENVCEKFWDERSHCLSKNGLPVDVMVKWAD